MTCVFIGDSIAVGVAQHRTECVNLAHVGQTTDATVNKIGQLPRTTQQVIVSVGSNDHLPHASIDVWIEHFEKLRVRLGSRQVIWLMLNTDPVAREATQVVARYHGDQVLDTRPFVSKDGIHPTPKGYQQLAKQIK